MQGLGMENDAKDYCSFKDAITGMLVGVMQVTTVDYVKIYTVSFLCLGESRPKGLRSSVSDNRNPSRSFKRHLTSKSPQQILDNLFPAYSFWTAFIQSTVNLHFRLGNIGHDASAHCVALTRSNGRCKDKLSGLI
jgi:hypothetical protein